MGHEPISKSPVHCNGIDYGICILSLVDDRTVTRLGLQRDGPENQGFSACVVLCVGSLDVNPTDEELPMAVNK